MPSSDARTRRTRSRSVTSRRTCRPVAWRSGAAALIDVELGEDVLDQLAQFVRSDLVRHASLDIPLTRAFGACTCCFRT